MTDPKLTLEAVGAELRSVVKHLESVASHVTVCRKALESQNADDDTDIAAVLRVSVWGLLFSQTRRLASRCDGRPVELFGEEDPDDDEDDIDNTEGNEP
ncbi:MAG: hypothetical protein JWN43_19 [Gammaproteobacteria bacterium]|nr:hypothetical protein [Gammaproteobacteria bacterium]